jgi:hypothetical protein
MAPRDCARRQASTLDELESHGIPPALGIDYDAAIADPSGTIQRIAEYGGQPTCILPARLKAIKMRGRVCWSTA